MSKIIPLSIKSGPYASKGLLTQVASLSPEKPINVAEMRTRVRIIDAIENADGDSFLLESSEYDLLKAAIQVFPFNVANKPILQIIDDVLNAIDGPVITKEMRDAAVVAATEIAASASASAAIESAAAAVAAKPS